MTRATLGCTLLLCAVVLGESRDALADPIFGSMLGTSAQACAVGASTCPSTSSASTGLLQAISNGPLSAALSQIEASVGGLGDLHIYSNISVSNQTGVPASGTNASNAADAFWYDTFFFEAGTYRIDLAFNGVDAYSAGFDHDRILTSSDVTRFQLVQDCTSIVFGTQYCPGVVTSMGLGQTRSVTMSFSAPTTTTLGGLLQVRSGLVIKNAVPIVGTRTIDASNTAFFDVVGLSEGASFTTASGIGYQAGRFDAATTVPEPSSLLLAALGIVGVTTGRKAARRRRVASTRPS